MKPVDIYDMKAAELIRYFAWLSAWNVERERLERQQEGIR